jgi:hypothetical protein
MIGLVCFALKMSQITISFECVVAKRAWAMISSVIGFQVGSDYESIAKMWLCNKKYDMINLLTSCNALIFKKNRIL